MASIIFKDKFEQEHWEKLTVTFDDYTEPNFFGLKIDDSKRQIILRLHKSELKQIMRKSGLLTEVIKQAKIEGDNLIKEISWQSGLMEWLNMHNETLQDKIIKYIERMEK